MKQIRIQMAISEVDDDGTPGKYITFDETMTQAKVYDWLVRIGESSKYIFDLKSHVYVRCVKTPINKIQAIKFYRCVTGEGLLNSKNAIESHAHRGAIWCESQAVADRVRRGYEGQVGAHVEIVPAPPFGSVSDHGRLVFRADEQCMQQNQV